MKPFKKYIASLLAILFLAMPLAGWSAEKPVTPQKKAAKAKPYPLKKCIVSDEEFGGDMGEPYVFTYKGQELKLCCKSCLKDFKKDPAKYMKKLDEAKKKQAKKTAEKKLKGS